MKSKLGRNPFQTTSKPTAEPLTEPLNDGPGQGFTSDAASRIAAEAASEQTGEIRRPKPETIHSTDESEKKAEADPAQNAGAEATPPPREDTREFKHFHIDPRDKDTLVYLENKTLDTVKEAMDCLFLKALPEVESKLYLLNLARRMFLK